MGRGLPGGRALAMQGVFSPLRATDATAWGRQARFK